MRAVQLVKFEEPREALQYTDLPDPKPGPGEVVVKIEAAGVCGRDLVVRKGAFPHVKPPVVPGHEGVGRVVEVGSGVEKELEGARAFLSAIYDGTCEYCRRGWRICVEMRSFWGVSQWYVCGICVVACQLCASVPRGGSKSCRCCCLSAFYCCLHS